MSSAMRTFLATAAFAAPLFFAACGSDDDGNGLSCGDGTSEVDGACVPTGGDDGLSCGGGTIEMNGVCVPAEGLTCGAGTQVMDGACVPSEDGTMCGAGTVEMNGMCVPEGDELLCGAGTVEMNGECVPDSPLTCGANTIEMNGMCVPENPITCGANTIEMNGMCVPENPIMCGPNTVEMNGECRPTSAVCAAGSIFDEATGACTLDGDAICSPGTTFDAATGTCVADISMCGPGRRPLMGTCVSPFEEARNTASVTIDELTDGVNDDTGFGGAPRALALVPGPNNLFSIAGRIEAARDLNADSVLDQDFDEYSFAATAGTLYRVTALEEQGGTSIAFEVSGPNGYIRYAPLGFGMGVSREIWIPRDGEYVVRVGPIAALLGAPGTFGSDDDYVLTIEELAAPTPTIVSATTPPIQITGQATDLSDNLFQVQGATLGELNDLVATLGDGIDGDTVIQIWESATTLTREIESVSDGDVYNFATPAMDYFVFVDWVQLTGSDTSFDLSIETTPNQIPLGPIAANGSATTVTQTFTGGEIYYASFEVTPGQIIEISQINLDDEELDLRLFDADGNRVISRTFFDVVGDASPDYFYVPALDGGAFVLEAETSGSADVTDVAITVRSVTPNDLGTIAPGVPAVFMRTTPLADEAVEFHTFTVTEAVDLTVTLDAMGTSDDPELTIYRADADTEIDDLTTGTLPRTSDSILLLPGTYFASVEANSNELEVGYTATFKAAATAQSVETEPNDTAATPNDLTALMNPSQVTGIISSATDEDYFTVAPGALGLTVTILEGPSTLMVEVIDPTTMMVLGTDRESFMTTSNLLVRVSGFDGASPFDTYTLAFSDFVSTEVEPNDTIATANPLSLGSSIQGTGGYSAGGQAREFTATYVPFDYYQLDLTSFAATDTVTISTTLEVTDPTGDGRPSSYVVVMLFDALGNEIARGGTSGTTKNDMFSVPGGAIYYIGVAVDLVTTFNTNYTLTAQAAVAPTP